MGRAVPLSRCHRCGAASREPLCPPCLDYLVAYHPLWLDPSLLPGPSLLDALGSQDVALLSSDLENLDWRSGPREPTDGDAIRLVSLLHLDAGSRPVVSAGDADVLHGFLGRARRSLVTDPGAKPAVAALYRYLSTREWMPPHLATEYGFRARLLEPAPEPQVDKEDLPRLEPAPGPAEVVQPESDDSLPSPPSGAVSVETTPEALSEPEGPLPAPDAAEGPPETIEAPAPETPPPGPAADQAAIQETRGELERQRSEMETWIRERAEDFASKERALAEREKALALRAEEIQKQEAATTDRLLDLEKDSARREVLRFLGTVLGMTEEVADIVATAFPDMRSLESADAKALSQCRGVTEALARAIRYQLVPGEVEQEDRTRELREEAQAFMEEGDFDGALACYNALLRERPVDTSVWFDKAEILVLLDRPEEALQCYTRVLDLDRRNRQAWFERGNLLFGMGRLADALDSLREGLHVDPSKSGDLILKADELRRDGRPNDAVVLLQAVLDVDPANSRAVLAYGDSLMDLGDIDAAEGFFTRVLGTDPANAAILLRKGQLLDRKGRWGAAIQFYNRAIALQWENPDAWLAKGRTLVAQGRGQDALECFDRALSFDPDRLDAWVGKAEAHVSRRQWDDAARAVDEVGHRSTTHPAYLRLREALARRDVPKLASPEPALGGASPAIESELEAAQKAPELPAEFRAFVESIDTAREDVEAILQLAELAMEGGDAPMALRRYEEAIAKDPRNSDAWTGKGVALQSLERYEEALRSYDEALRIAPAHDVATRWRETCLRRLQRGNPT